MKIDQTLLPGALTHVMGDADIAGTVTGCPGIAKHANGLASTFTGMVAELADGNAKSVIRYINNGGIVSDVESLLGYALTREQRSLVGLTCPSHIDDLVLSRACSIARELQALRATARKTCQMYQAHGTGSKELHGKLTGHLRAALGILGTWYEYEGVPTDEGDTFETW